MLYRDSCRKRQRQTGPLKKKSKNKLKLLSTCWNATVTAEGNGFHQKEAQVNSQGSWQGGRLCLLSSEISWERKLRTSQQSWKQREIWNPSTLPCRRNRAYNLTTSAPAPGSCRVQELLTYRSTDLWIYWPLDLLTYGSTDLWYCCYLFFENNY